MKIAIVVTGGNAPLFIPDTLPLDDTYIIAADSGLDIAEILGLKCDLAIGDFDSIQNRTLLSNIAFKEYPSDKDYSDTELAIKYVKDMGYENYVLIGGGEGRMDHLLNIWSLFDKYGSPICWITRRESMYLVDKKRSFITAKGETVSVIPSSLHEDAEVDCDALKWKLKNFKINNSHLSLSNESTKGNLVLESQGGKVYVVFENPRENHW
jgi:thiamine pyrophosphokinase